MAVLGKAIVLALTFGGRAGRVRAAPGRSADRVTARQRRASGTCSGRPGSSSVPS